MPAALEGGGVGDGDVTVYAGEERGMAAGYGIEIGAGGQRGAGPQGVVPAAAGEPGAGRGSLRGCADAGLGVSERAGAGEVDREADVAGLAEVNVGIVEAGHHEGAMEVDDLRGRAAEAGEEIGFGTGVEDIAVENGERVHVDRAVGGERGAGEDVSVRVDGLCYGGVRGRLCRGCEGRACCEQTRGGKAEQGREAHSGSVAGQGKGQGLADALARNA